MSLGMHHLDVGQVVSVIARAVRDEGRLDRIERFSDRSFSERVVMHLEPEPVELGHVAFQGLGLDEGDAPVVGRFAVRVEVRVQNCRREVLADAVLHDLDARRCESAHSSPFAELDQLLDLVGPTMTIPPERADHSSGQVTPAGSFDVPGEVVSRVRPVVDDRVLPGRDAQ